MIKTEIFLCDAVSLQQRNDLLQVSYEQSKRLKSVTKDILIIIAIKHRGKLAKLSVT